MKILPVDSRGDRNTKLAASLSYAIGEDIRRPKTELDFDSGDLGDTSSPSDGLGRDFTKSNATDRAIIHILLQRWQSHSPEINIFWDPSPLKDIDLFLSIQQFQRILDTIFHILSRTVNLMLGVQAGFYAEDNFIGILWVFVEVGGEELERVVVWHAVEVAAVPEIAAGAEGSLHGGDGLFNGDWGWVAPREACGVLLTELVVMRSGIPIRPKPISPTSFPRI